MTKAPAPTNAPGLPEIGDIYTEALIVLDLMKAMDDLRGLIGPDGGPVSALITTTLPAMQRIADDLEKHYENRN